MKLTVHPSRIAGEIAVTGSKSHTIRGIAAGALCHGTATLIAPLESADTRSALEAIKSFGAKVNELNDRWVIEGVGGKFADSRKVIDMGNSGTGLRMLSGLAALQDFKITFDGDESLRTRLMSGLLDSFAQLGAEVVSNSGKCPLTICGPVRGGSTKADGTTSQFLTSLLFSLPMAEGDSEITLDFLNEKPYIDITLSWLDTLGIKVEHSEDCLHWCIPGGQSVNSFTRVIAADFSTAAFPLVAGVIAGNGVGIRNLDFNDVQGDKKVFSYLEDMGAKLERTPELLKIVPDRPLTGKVIDLNETPDALPIMAVAACNASGETRLVNAPQARVKETDRIACMTRELSKMGADVEELPDGMVIRGRQLHGAEVESYGDHRIAMALAIAGLTAEGETVIRDAECASVTYPAFVKDFVRLGADFKLS